tara:strand:- start:737 stop:982 length:246 start_codon:yes stop_codon:yes gene_type:complete
MKELRKEIMSMNLSELNDLGDFIRDVKVMNAKSTLKVGMEVYVVQKTKRELGVITKINIKKAIVRMRNRSYSVPMSMLEAA